MKAILHYLLAACLLLTITAGFGQQKNIDPSKKGTPAQAVDTRIDNMGYWMKMAEQGRTPYNPKVNIPPAIYRGSQIRANGVKTFDSPDVAVTDLTDVTESENSVFVDPENADYILNSNNSTTWSGGSVGSIYGANYFQSSDAGIGWVGSPEGAGGSNSGDPTTAINHAGRQYVNFISDPGGQGIAYSDNGTTWSTATVAPNPGDLADKNHMWIDNKVGSPYVGNVYVAWTDFGGTDDTQIKISRSVNNGATWSTGLNLSSAIVAGSHNQGVNIQTGPNGEVYVAWAVYDSWPSDETAIGFAKSTDGGATFPAATRVITNIKGIRTTGVSKTHRVNSFPVMAVDISGGPNNGNIYIVWTNVGVPGTNTGTNKSVYMARSTDGGSTWSTPVRVNQGPNTAGKEAYFPWISCDPETGVLSVVFYDDRNVTSTQCEVYSAYSTDAGATWTDFLVSDVAFTPSPISGLASSYMGDYLGITSKGGKVYPCWTDNRGGIYMTYVSPYELGLNAGFRADKTTICTGSGVTFTDGSTGPPTTWTWSFPGGSPSSYVGTPPPTITYNTPGTYDVSLEVSDGVTTDTELKTGYITVKNVIADFTGTPANVVIDNTVSFTDNSLCDAETWEWSFPGGTPSSYTGQTPPPVTYSTLGTYDVSLTVTKSGSSDTKTKTGYITVSPPVFNITNGSVTTCRGDFYDTGGPTGTYSNSEIIVETFYPSTPGSMIRFDFTSFVTELNYDTLTIYNGANSTAPLIGKFHGTTGPGVVIASNVDGALTFRFRSDGSVVKDGWTASISCYSTTDPPVADFSANLLNPMAGTTISFTDMTINFPTAWEWSFSPPTVAYVEGTSATSQNPKVQFLALGQYTVSLKATNGIGSNTMVKPNYIEVTVPLVAGFSASSVTPPVTQTVTFTDASSNSPTSWAWAISPGTFSFEGGTSATSQNPQVKFLAVGVYSVTLTATNAYGSDEEVKPNYINAVALVADFSATPLNPLIDQTVTFSDLTSNSPTSWAWSITPGTFTYVGGTSASSQNPQVQFSALGAYSITLTATNIYGSDTKTKTDYITCVPPIFNMTNGTVTTCTGDFYDSGGSAGQYSNSETFIETFYPATPGSKIRFTFSAFTTELNYDTLTIYDGINSTGTLIGKFHGTTGPGTVTATNPDGALTFRFHSDGSVVKDGWAAAITCYSTTSAPVADFSASVLYPLVGQTVTFTDLSLNYPTTWAWVFDPATVSFVGGTTAASQNPQVQFNALGAYTVTLTAGNGYGSDPETKTNYINVTACTFNTLPFSENFTSTTLPNCWSQIDHQGNGQIWKFGTFSTPTPVPILTGNYAYLNSDGYGNGNTQNADLVTPTLNLSYYTGVTLQFSHFFRSYSGSSGTLSYSINNGSTWTQIQQFTTTTANPETFNQVITAVAQQAQVKFKWNYTGTWGYCWGIDNLLITGTSTVPATQDLQNVTVTGPQCYNATQVITVAGNGNFFKVESGGVAKMYAGQEIFLYPGTTVVPGGYMLCKIATDNLYCPLPGKESTPAGEKIITVNPEKSFFRIYPNPTTGEFTLAMNGYVPSEQITVSIYNTNGEKVISNKIVNEMKHQFTLAGWPAGLYLVKVESGSQRGSTRIIKCE